MAILHETLSTDLPPEEVFAFIADFSNAALWDPGVAWSRRVGQGDTPPGVGSRFELGVRMGGRIAPMEYVVTTWDPSRRVVLRGTGSGVQAVDDIRFEPQGSGTRIEYRADIRLTGLLRLLAPFANGAFARIALNARTGMQRALDGRVAARQAVAR